MPRLATANELTSKLELFFITDAPNQLDANKLLLILSLFLMDSRNGSSTLTRLWAIFTLRQHVEII